MAIKRLQTYKRESNFYNNELRIVKEEIEATNNNKAKLQEESLKQKKEQSTFTLKYNLATLSLAILSNGLEIALPGSMLVMFGIQSILDGELTNLESIKSYYDKLDDNLVEVASLKQINSELNSKKNKRFYFEDKLYMLELIKKGYLKFELKNGKMAVSGLSSPLYLAYLDFKDFFDEEIFLPDYYKNKKTNIKTLQKQIKAK